MTQWRRESEISLIKYWRLHPVRLRWFVYDGLPQFISRQISSTAKRKECCAKWKFSSEMEISTRVKNLAYLSLSNFHLNEYALQKFTVKSLSFNFLVIFLSFTYILVFYFRFSFRKIFFHRMKNEQGNKMKMNLWRRIEKFFTLVNMFLLSFVFASHFLLSLYILVSLVHSHIRQTEQQPQSTTSSTYLRLDTIIIQFSRNIIPMPNWWIPFIHTLSIFINTKLLNRRNFTRSRIRGYHHIQFIYI